MLCLVQITTEKQREQRWLLVQKKRKRGMRDSQTKWGTGQWNTYGQLPRKCCEKEEISKRIKSESQEVCCGCALVWLGWCLSFFHTVISSVPYVNTAMIVQLTHKRRLRNPVEGADRLLILLYRWKGQITAHDHSSSKTILLSVTPLIYSIR